MTTSMTEPIEVYVDLAKALEANESALADGKTNTTRLEILKTGDWKTDRGRFSITEQTFSEMVNNFNTNVRPHSATHGLPIDEEHSKKAALGWLKNPSVEANDRGGKSLFMDAAWTKAGLEKVKDGTYKFFSPEVHFEHPDPEGILPKLRNVLMGGGVTNRPLFKGLAGIPALTASEGETDPENKIYVTKENPVPNLEEVRVKENDKVTEEERRVLEAAKDQLTDEERTKFFPEAPAADSPEAKAAAEKEAADKAAADKAEADKRAAEEAAKKPAAAGVTGSEGETVTLTASEKKTLEENSAKGLEASERLARADAEKEVTDMCFSETEGIKLPTDMKEPVTSLWLNASETEKATLKKMFEKVQPLLDKNAQRIMGSDEAGNGTAVDLLDDKTAEIQASEAGKALSYQEALKQARRQNPDIAKEADQEMSREQPQLANR